MTGHLPEMGGHAGLKYAISVFNAFVFGLLIVTGIWLFFVTQLQAFRKLRSNGFTGMKLTLFSYTYNLLAASLIASIFLH